MFAFYLGIFCLALVFIQAQGCSKCNANCSTGDCIAHDVSQQTGCVEVANEPPKSTQCQWWGNGLASTTDLELLGGKIVAYKLKWFNGSWSGWFVPGVNDLDCKYNNYSKTCNGKTTCYGSLRRWWSYFYDHYHTYIICKP